MVLVVNEYISPLRFQMDAQGQERLKERRKKDFREGGQFLMEKFPGHYGSLDVASSSFHGLQRTMDKTLFLARWEQKGLNGSPGEVAKKQGRVLGVLQVGLDNVNPYAIAVHGLYMLGNGPISEIGTTQEIVFRGLLIAAEDVWIRNYWYMPNQNRGGEANQKAPSRIFIVINGDSLK